MAVVWSLGAMGRNCSLDGAKRNPEFGDPTSQAAPDFAALHPGYDAGRVGGDSGCCPFYDGGRSLKFGLLRRANR
jgi:hypothetical protein